MEAASLAMNRMPPDFAAARTHFRYLLSSPRPSTRQLGWLGLLAIDCQVQGSVALADLDAAFAQPPETIEADLLRSFEFLGNRLIGQPCASLTSTEMAGRLSALLDQRQLLNPGFPNPSLRLLAARLYQHAGRLDLATEQLQIAWRDDDAEAPIGAMLVGVLINQGDITAARAILPSVEARIGRHDDQGHRIIEQYRKKLYAPEATEHQN